MRMGAKVQTALMVDSSKNAVSKAELEKGAFLYLGRYASSVKNLRCVLNRRLVRARIKHRPVPEAASEWVDDVVAACAAKGFVDDANYACMLARSDLRQGRSRWKIQARLRQKGVGGEDIAGALDHILEDFEDAQALDMAAARVFAKRRRFGLFRTAAKKQSRDEREKMIRREIASFARAGFSYEIARRFVNAEKVQELEN